MTDFVNLAYGNTSAGTYTPFQLFAGDGDVRTRDVTVVTGQNLAAGTVVALVVEGQLPKALMFTGYVIAQVGIILDTLPSR